MRLFFSICYSHFLLNIKMINWRKTGDEKMKDKKNVIFYVLLIMQPIIDIITSLMTRFIDLPLTLGLIVRGTVFMIEIYYLLFKAKDKYAKRTKIYLLTIGLFFIGYFITKLDIFTNLNFMKEELTYIFKYFYTIVSFLFLLNFFFDYKPNNRIVFRILLFNLFLYCFSIVIANITGTSFSTYADSIGTTGWFFAGNEIGIIIALMFPLIFLLMNKLNSYYTLIYILPIVFGAELIGTKTAMAGLLTCTIVMSLYYLNRIKEGKKKQFIITIIILIVVIISTPNLPVVSNIKKSLDLFHSEREEQIKLDQDYNNSALTSLLLSNRDYYLKKTSAIYKKAKMGEKLFGIGFVNRKEINNKNISKLIEMDFYDIFYHYGIIGFIVYLIPFLYYIYFSLKKIINLKFKLNIKQILLIYTSYIGFAIAYMCGHVMGAPAVSIYVSLAMALSFYYLEKGYYNIDVNEKKITILALHLGIGGVEKYIYSLTEMLKDNYDIEIISTYKLADNPAFDFDKNIKIEYLINDYPRKKELLEAKNNKKVLDMLKYGVHSTKIILLKYLRNIDAIEQINSRFIITTRPFHSKLVGYNKNRKITCIATEHNYHDKNDKYVKKLVDSLNNVSYLVVVNEKMKSIYTSKLCNTKCIYIPNVIDSIPKYADKEKINNKLIAVGRLSKEKGFLDLIDIIKIVKKDIPDISLDIYGDGIEKQRIEDKIISMNLQDNIKLKGFVSNEKILDLYTKYDLFTMTSYTESFGIVLIEAMSRSLVCIGFDSADGVKALLNNDNGILIKNRNKEDYANAIILTLKNIKKLKKISKKAYNSISIYSFSNVKKMWLELLKKINNK